MQKLKNLNMINKLSLAELNTKANAINTAMALNAIKGGEAVVIDVEYDSLGVPILKSKVTFNGKIYDTSNV
jgi:hypothetical protein